MSKLIINIDQVKKFVPSNISSEFSLISPYLDQAETDYILPIIGKNLLETLGVYISSGQEGSSTVTDELVKICRRALANFAYYDAIPMLDVVATNQGFAVVSSQNISPASKDRVKALREGLQKFAYKALESLLQYLEENEASFPEWTSSDAYQNQTEFFINSAKEFQKYIDIENSRLKFLKLRPLIRDSEKMFIEQTISSELCNTLKEHYKNEQLTAAEQKIYPLIQAALAWFVASQDKELFDRYEDANYKATKYMGMILNIMIADIDNYPDYRDSDLYDDSDPFQNEEDNTIFVMG